MKKLIILRHAKSSWEELDVSDFERPLSKRGLLNAEQMGEFIAAKEGVPDLILASSARRALDTASIIAKQVGYPSDKIQTDRELYLAWVSEILKRVCLISNEVKKCIIVGHNPGFTDLINYLGIRLDNLPTASAACFEFDTNNWEKISRNNASLSWFQEAKRLS